MAISHIGSNIAGATGSTSIAVANPAGVATDDLIIVQGSLSRSGSTFLNASYTGWTILRGETQLVDGSTIISRIVYRFADGTATDTPPTFQTGTSGNTIATVGVYRGVDKTSPFVAENFTVEATSQTAHSGPVLNNTVAGAWGIFFGAARQVVTPQSWTATSPLVLRRSGESGAANTNNAAHLLADTNGSVATGNHTWAGATAVATQVATMWAGLLRPAAAGPTNLDKLRIGNDIPTAIKIGTETVTKVYLGSVQIWP